MAKDCAHNFRKIGGDPMATFFKRAKRLNPYKIGPFGKPIKNGLLGRFPTLRKDDSDVKSGRPPPPPPPGPVGYVTVGGRFSAISRLRSMLKSNQKH